MKNNLTVFGLLSILLLVFFSCKKRNENILTSDGGTWNYSYGYTIIDSGTFIDLFQERETIIFGKHIFTMVNTDGDTNTGTWSTKSGFAELVSPRITKGFIIETPIYKNRQHWFYKEHYTENERRLYKTTSISLSR